MPLDSDLNITIVVSAPVQYTSRLLLLDATAKELGHIQWRDEAMLDNIWHTVNWTKTFESSNDTAVVLTVVHESDLPIGAAVRNGSYMVTSALQSGVYLLSNNSLSKRAIGGVGARRPFRRQLSLGASHGCYIDGMGLVRCFGAEIFTFSPGKKLSVSSAGTSSSCVLTADNKAECVAMNARNNPVYSLSNNEYIQVASVGLEDYVCGLRFDLTVECWELQRGQREIKALNVVHMALRAGISCFIGLQAQVWCTISTQTCYLSDTIRFAQVEIDYDLMCGLTLEGHIYCWSCSEGQVTFHPHNLTDRSYVEVAVGNGRVCALDHEGGVGVH